MSPNRRFRPFGRGNLKINMEYNKIIAVTGLPGLYELLNSKTDGAIVRSLDDKSTRFVSSRIHNFSHLESIEVYTVRDNVNLVDILKAMEASNAKLPDEKDGDALKAYFTKVYPDLDFTRVYSSDLKKMVKWFVVLKANDIEIKLTEPEEGNDESPAGEDDEQPAQQPKPAKKKEEAAKPAPAKKAPAETPAKAATKKAATPAKAAPEAPKAEKKAAASKSDAKKAKPAKASKKAAPKASDKPKPKPKPKAGKKK